MTVSKRLMRIAALASCAGQDLCPEKAEERNGVLLADIGCDHGYTALCALECGAAAEVLCADINEGPLMQAVRNFRRSGKRGQAAFLLSDGLRAAALPDGLLKEAERKHRDAFQERLRSEEADVDPELCSDGTDQAAPADTDPCSRIPDVIVLSGMGGKLMQEILCLLPTNGDRAYEEETLFAAARRYLSAVSRLILSPQSEPELIRHLLTDRLDMRITDEEMLLDEGKRYLLMSVAPKERAERERYRTEADYRYGVWLFAKRDPVWRAQLSEAYKKNTVLLEKLPEGAPRRKALQAETEEIAAYLSSWERTGN